MTKINPVIPKLFNTQFSKAKISGRTIKDIVSIGSTTAAVVTAPIVLAQCKSADINQKQNLNGTIIEPKEFSANNRREESVYELYSGKKAYPYYDSDDCIFTKKAKPIELPKKRYAVKDEVIYVSNFDIPKGTVAGTSTLDKILYTDTLRVCAALAIVDKAHNTQTLIHVFPGFTEKANKEIIGHIISASKPEDLELSVVPGYYPGTTRTLQFIFDTLKELVPKNTPKLYNFSDDISISKRGLLLYNGKLSCCDMEQVKYKRVNPIENITYSKYEEEKYVKAKDVENVLLSMKFSKKFDRKELKLWAIDNNLKRQVINGGTIDFKDEDGKVVREIRADYPDISSIWLENRYFYDDKGNQRAIMSKEKGYPVRCEYNFGLKERKVLINNKIRTIRTDRPEQAILIDGVWYDLRSDKKLPKNPITDEPQ